MKYVNVVQSGMTYDGFILLDDLSDLSEYFTSIEPEFRSGILTLLKTREPMERWGHLARRTTFGNILNHAAARVDVNGGNTLFEIAKLYDSKFATMANFILNGRRIMVNKFGGYCFVADEADVTYIPQPEKHIDYYIAQNNAKYINLENDSVLETYTLKHCRDGNISYVMNAFTLTRPELKKILQEFKDVGGIGIWQYTTAMDIDQLYMFINTGIDVGLSEFIINFNSGTNDDIDELIKKYQSNETIKFEAKFI